MYYRQSIALTPEFGKQSIANVIHEIETSGGFAIFLADEGKNYYVQISLQANDSLVYAEAVGNVYLSDDAKLSSSALNKLEESGWSSSGDAQANYSQSWDDAGADAIAEVLATTLQEVYGWDGESALGITVERD